MASHIKLICEKLHDEPKPYPWKQAEEIFRICSRIGVFTHEIAEPDKYEFLNGEIRHKPSEGTSNKKGKRRSDAPKG